VVVGATVVHILLIPSGAELRAGLGVLVALYTVGERVQRRVGMAITLLTGAVIAVLLIGRTPLAQVLQSLIQTELIFGVAWLLGDATRIRRLYTRSLERDREEQARRAVVEERGRIARELHDAVAHHVSVVVIQAGAAQRALDGRTDDARTALTAIGTSGRQALTDMRRMLDLLGEREADAPMPGLDRLGDLLEQVRAAGLAVELSVHGERRPLDPGLELSAYRIIQEALTNSLKHAGGGRARVTVRYAPTELEITVDDERGAEATTPVEPEHDGRGLLGMRERVALFRGRFAAEPTATGFSVSARLPLDRGTA
jgi:signal transduction histidine kinase